MGNTEKAQERLGKFVSFEKNASLAIYKETLAICDKVNDLGETLNTKLSEPLEVEIDLQIV